MATDSSFDIIIIGGGPGGYETAVEAAALGRRVALVEQGELGGTCLNRGCIPTKALASSAQAAMTLRRAAEFGLGAVDTAVSLPGVMARKDEIVKQLRQGVESLMTAPIELIRGEARIEGSTVVVNNGELRIEAPQVIIATGSKPARLNIPGAEYAVTSDELLDLQELPARMVIVGGGVIGVEFASIFAAFGVEVTILEYCPEILPPFDSEVAKRLRMALKRRKIKIETSVAVKSIAPDLTVTAADRRGERTFAADLVVMAVGRRPVMPEGTAESGIACTPRGIEVDPLTMATSRPGFYAIGDVNGLMMLAHAATAQGRVALGLSQPLAPVPSVVFSMPEASMVGLTEQQCAELGLDVAIGRSTFRANGRAVASGEPDGMVKVIVDRATARVVGGHIVGPHAADLIQELTLAITSGIPAVDAANAIHAHPTLCEAVQAALRAALQAK